MPADLRWLGRSSPRLRRSRQPTLVVAIWPPENRARTSSFSPKVGDLVRVHRPQTRKGVASKALLQWDGPFRVMSKVASNIWECKHHHTGQIVRASTGDIKIYPVTALPSSSEAKAGNPAPDFPPGSIVATRDSVENPRLIWLSTVTAISADDAEWRAVEYFATRSHRAPFKFLPCWVDERDDALVLAKTKTSRQILLSLDWYGACGQHPGIRAQPDRLGQYLGGFDSSSGCCWSPASGRMTDRGLQLPFLDG